MGKVQNQDRFMLRLILQIFNSDDGEVVLEQKKHALKRSLSIDGEYYHDKAATLPRERMKFNKEVGFRL